MRARTMIRTAAVIVLIALTIPRGSAQVSEQVSVELVEVPVYVRSVGGSPVQGLSRDAFELYVNGRRQEIEYFDAINFGARATPSAPAAQRVRSSRESASVRFRRNGLGRPRKPTENYDRSEAGI